MPFGLFDPTFLLLLPAMGFALWAQHKVKSTYEQFSTVPAANGLTGREMASTIMNRNGVGDVNIEPVAGVLSDHYDPGAKSVRLSQGNYGGRSIAAIAVAAHEVGHVLQHHQGWFPLVLRSQLAPVAGFGTLLMDIGILFFAAAVLFHVVTLPVEFDASNRALAQLTSTGALMPQEVAGAKKVLDAAALTYVAAAAMAALQLVRLLILRDSRR